MNDKLKQEINKSLEILKGGGIILYPTDTIWGIGCDATNEEAVKRIYEIKKREDNKAMLMLVDDIGKIFSYADIPDIAFDIMAAADKPITIIYPNAKNIAKNLVGDDKSIGIRVSNEDFTKNLIQRFRRPIVSTSANISGEKSALSFEEISEEIKSKVDYIVDYNRENNIKHKSSGIIKLNSDGTIKIIRE